MNKNRPYRISLLRGITSLAAIWLASILTVSFAALRMPELTVGESVIDLDAAKLFAVDQRRATFELNMGADRPLTLSHERVLPGSDGARTWVGQARELSGDFSEGTAYITELQGHIYGTISTGATTYEVIGRPGEAVIVRDLAARGVQIEINLRDDAVIPPVLGPRVAELPLGLDTQKALPTPQVTIDLMLVYTTAFTARHGAGSGVTTRLNNLVAQANDAYLRSDVAITLRLVRTEETTYTNANSNSVALDEISNATGVFASIPGTRNTFAADLVALVRPYDKTAHSSSCGIAWVGGYQQTALLSQYGFSVIGEGNDLGGSNSLCLDKAFQHELGHNMGLMHDRATVIAGNGGNISYGATSYAFGYIIPGTNPSVGDIMSYSSRSVNCFSSPNVFRQGPVSGLSGGNCNVTPTTGDVLGVVAATTASSADAAAALNFTRQSVAAFRTAATITISGTVMNGASPLSGVQFCARPSAGVVCPTPTNGSGAFSCTVPNGWSGTLHAAGPSGLRIKPLVFTTVGASLSAQNPVVQAIGSCNLDVDNNGLIEPATDGVAIIRRMLGFNVAAFGGLAGTCAANTTSAAIFNATNSNYNVTGGAATSVATDGMVILRAMNGKTNADVTNGLGLANESGATNTGWLAIQSWLNATCGGSF